MTAKTFEEFMSKTKRTFAPEYDGSDMEDAFNAGRAAAFDEAADIVHKRANEIEVESGDIGAALIKVGHITVATEIRALNKGGDLCDDCPPADYPTDKTRCEPCPRRALNKEGE